MWATIAEAISGNLQIDFSIVHKQPISAGELNQHFIIANDKHKFFVKLQEKHHLESLEAEVENLRTIASNQIIRVPKVIAIGTSINKAFLVTEYINFTAPSADNWRALGEQLAQLHQTTTHGQYGWGNDNYIGQTIQPNPWMSNWRTFFSEQRIAWQLQLLQEKSIVLGDIEHITQVCHDHLLHHNLKPCLVHGDLWQGNIGFTKEHAIIYDPACYYGDREVDIAMTELFGRFPEEFYNGYNSIYPLAPNYEKRKLVYNFYHILNHANIFGEQYIEQAKATLKRIIVSLSH